MSNKQDPYNNINAWLSSAGYRLEEELFEYQVSQAELDEDDFDSPEETCPIFKTILF